MPRGFVEKRVRTTLTTMRVASERRRTSSVRGMRARTKSKGEVRAVGEELVVEMASS